MSDNKVAIPHVAMLYAGNISRTWKRQRLRRPPCNGVVGRANIRLCLSVFAFFAPGGHSSKPSCVYDARKLLADCKLPERILLLAELLKALTRKVDCDSLRDLRIAQPHLLEQGVVSRV
jgi:hypothetical protein